MECQEQDETGLQAPAAGQDQDAGGRLAMAMPSTRPSVSSILSTPVAHQGSRGRRLVAILLRPCGLEPGLWLASPARPSAGSPASELVMAGMPRVAVPAWRPQRAA